MSSMIERIAGVLADNAGDGRDYTDVARAVIKAMRDPTEQMRSAMEEDIDWDGDVVRAYHAAIDAALQ